MYDEMSLYSVAEAADQMKATADIQMAGVLGQQELRHCDTTLTSI